MVVNNCVNMKSLVIKSRMENKKVQDGSGVADSSFILILLRWFWLPHRSWGLHGSQDLPKRFAFCVKITLWKLNLNEWKVFDLRIILEVTPFKWSSGAQKSMNKHWTKDETSLKIHGINIKGKQYFYIGTSLLFETILKKYLERTDYLIWDETQVVGTQIKHTWI